MVIVCDDEDRENEGDLTMAAQFVTPEAINFMATHGRGLICLALSPRRCDELHLRPMVRAQHGPLPDRLHGVDRGARGVTTGISAADRAHTIQVAVDPEPSGRPGPAGPRVPARGEPGGVLGAPARPRPASTWRVWPGCSRRR